MIVLIEIARKQELVDGEERESSEMESILFIQRTESRNYDILL